MTTHHNFLHLRVGIGLSLDNRQADTIREKTTRFYWDIFQLVNKNKSRLQDHSQARVLRLSFEDDFTEQDEEVDGYEGEDWDEEDFPAGQALSQEEASLVVRPDQPTELFYK